LLLFLDLLSVVLSTLKNGKHGADFDVLVKIRSFENWVNIYGFLGQLLDNYLVGRRVGALSPDQAVVSVLVAQGGDDAGEANEVAEAKAEDGGEGLVS
jgi:hypothetical protein